MSQNLSCGSKENVMNEVGQTDDLEISINSNAKPNYFLSAHVSSYHKTAFISKIPICPGVWVNKQREWKESKTEIKKMCQNKSLNDLLLFILDSKSFLPKYWVRSQNKNNNFLFF